MAVSEGPAISDSLAASSPVTGVISTDGNGGSLALTVGANGSNFASAGLICGGSMLAAALSGVVGVGLTLAGGNFTGLLGGNVALMGSIFCEESTLGEGLSFHVPFGNWIRLDVSTLVPLLVIQPVDKLIKIIKIIKFLTLTLSL